MATRKKAALETQITNLLANNTSGDISAADVRSIFQDVLDSLIFPDDLRDEIDSVTGSTSWRTAGGVSIQDVLDEILAGTGIDVDTSTPGQITISYAPPHVHTDTRYFGWSADQTIETSDFSSAEEATDNVGMVPARSGGLQYIYAAVPESAGEPADFLIGNNAVFGTPFTRQTGTVDDANGEPHIVIVTNSRQVAALGGQRAEARY